MAHRVTETALRWTVVVLGCALMLPLSAMSLRADPLGAQLERQLPLLMERHGVAGVNAVILREGREVWAGSFGMADPEAAIAMTRESVFRVGGSSRSWHGQRCRSI